jgi:hypothetical protein
MRSWHDYRLNGYRVDGERKELSLSLVWREHTSVEVPSAELVFSGVVDYFFEHDLGTNIVFAIEESPVEPFVRENAHMFQREQKWGWPKSWKGSVEETIRHLKEKQMKLWVLSSSYGLSGWILGSGASENAKAA